MSGGGDYLYFPPTQGQYSASSAHLKRDEFSGMCGCPWKRASIAAMKCVEYRAHCGLAGSCSAQPSKELIAELKAALEEAAPGAFDSVNRRGPGRLPKVRNRSSYYLNVVSTLKYGVCDCGQPACYRKTRECMNCYYLRRHGNGK